MRRKATFSSIELERINIIRTPQIIQSFAEPFCRLWISKINITRFSSPPTSRRITVNVLYKIIVFQTNTMCRLTININERVNPYGNSKI
ncbi:hypothetical protein PGB90_006551 [Kerria lacca]